MKGRGEKKKIHRRPSSLCLCVCLCVWAEAVKAAAETSLCGRDIKNRCRRLFLSGVTDSQRKARLPRQPRPVGRLRKVSASAPAWWFVESPRSSTDLGSVQRGGGEKRGEVRVWRCSTSVMECKARFLFWKRSSLSLSQDVAFSSLHCLHYAPGSQCPTSPQSQVQSWSPHHILSAIL